MKTITLNENQIRLLIDAMTIAEESGELPMEDGQDEKDWEELCKVIS